MTTIPARPVGVLLAAGAGRRMGMPKALVRGAGGEPWLARAAGILLDAGCSPVVVVLGAAAAEARTLLPPDPRVEVVVADDWRLGMSASLAAGIRAAQATGATAAVVTLVDLPALPLAAVTRLLEPPPDRSALRRAGWDDGAPGHPVVIGRDHWGPVLDCLAGDEGAGRYLLAHGAELVDCADLGDGRDVDSAEAD